LNRQVIIIIIAVIMVILILIMIIKRFKVAFYTFMIPFQLSPVATRNRVKNAMPKLRKWACLSRPWHG